jgi:hypothetical protein
MTKEDINLIMMGAALVGAYAAYLTIKEKTSTNKSGQFSSLGSSFAGDFYDFYNLRDVQQERFNAGGLGAL